MRHIVRLLIVLIVFLPLVFISSCCDEEDAQLHVFVGHLSKDECLKNANLVNASSDNIVFICKGEEVTLCWAGTVDSVDPGVGSVSSPGIAYQRVESDTDFVAKPPSGSCASQAKVTVNVVTEDTPSTWDAKWNSACSKIEFEINKEFMSENIKAKDITATWQPTLDTDGDGVGDFLCSTPPFLDGFQQEEVFGFAIKEPNITEDFSRKLKAVGHWQFVWKANCGVGDFKCNQFASFPFNLTLTCE